MMLSPNSRAKSPRYQSPGQAFEVVAIPGDVEGLPSAFESAVRLPEKTPFKFHSVGLDRLLWPALYSVAFDQPANLPVAIWRFGPASSGFAKIARSSAAAAWCTSCARIRVTSSVRD